MPTLRIRINPQDKRDIRALRLLQGARTWAKTTREIPGIGARKFYGIPSESQSGVYRLANQKQCSCEDFQNRQDGGTFACSHIRAVRMYVGIVLQERRKAAAAQVEFERQQEMERMEAEAKAKADHSWRTAQRLGLVDAF